MSSVWCLKSRIAHACLDSSLAWVGGWRGVVETLFGRRPRVLVSYLLLPSLMLQPCMDYIQERDSLDMATEQDDCYIVRFKRLEGGRRGLWRR